MAKNRWYSKEEDAYIRRRLRQLRVAKLPYGRRSAIYRQMAREMERHFGITRTARGVQQRARIIGGVKGKSGGEPDPEEQGSLGGP